MNSPSKGLSRGQIAAVIISICDAILCFALVFSLLRYNNRRRFRQNHQFGPVILGPGSPPVPPPHGHPPPPPSAPFIPRPIFPPRFHLPGPSQPLLTPTSCQGANNIFYGSFFSQSSNGHNLLDALDPDLEAGISSIWNMPIGASLWDIEINKSTLGPPMLRNNELFYSESQSGLSDHGQAESASRCIAENSTEIIGEDDASEQPLSPGKDCNTFPNTSNLTCMECGKAFSKQHKLNRHMRLQHVKPHKCPAQGCRYNEEGFGKPSDLKRHLSNVHNLPDGQRDSYMCPVTECRYHADGFGRRDNWKRHVVQQHGIAVD